MKFIILLLIIGVCNARPQPNRDFDLKMEEAQQRMDEVRERSDRHWEEWEKERELKRKEQEKRWEEWEKEMELREKEREKERELREKEREKKRELREKQQKQRDQEREKRREEREKEKEQRDKERKQRQKDKPTYLVTSNPEIQDEFRNYPSGGYFFEVKDSDGNILTQMSSNNDLGGADFEWTGSNGQYYYHKIDNVKVNGVIHRTITHYNPQTKQYEITKYTKNVNDSNAEFVKV